MAVLYRNTNGCGCIDQFSWKTSSLPFPQSKNIFCWQSYFAEKNFLRYKVLFFKTAQGMFPVLHKLTNLWECIELFSRKSRPISSHVGKITPFAYIYFIKNSVGSKISNFQNCAMNFGCTVQIYDLILMKWVIFQNLKIIALNYG